MLVAEPQENEINLENIDAEIRMENIRQNARKITWDGLREDLKKFIRENRTVLDADSRIDVINAISIMRKKMPIDETASFEKKVQLLVESFECTFASDPEKFFLKNNDVSIEIGYSNDKLTGCRIGYWGGPLVVSEEASKLLENGKFTIFRDCIFNILSILPSNLLEKQRNVGIMMLEFIERNLIKEGGELSTQGINAGLGFYMPRTLLQPGRLYFFADKLFEKHYGTPTVDANDQDVLPYLEVLIVSNDKPNAAGLEACICLKFSEANLFSSQTLRRLEKFIAKAPLVRHYTNQYRYMGGREKLTGNLHLLSNFPSEYTQHLYEIDLRHLIGNNDAVVVEIYIKEMEMLEEVVSIIRSEWIHNKLWESILAFCRKAKRAEGPHGVIHVKTILERRRFEFIFSTNVGLINVEIREIDLCKWSVRSVVAATGSSVSEELDRRMTDKLNSYWSITRTLLYFSTQFKCTIVSPDQINVEDYVCSKYKNVPCSSSRANEANDMSEENGDENPRQSQLLQLLMHPLRFEEEGETAEQQQYIFNRKRVTEVFGHQVSLNDELIAETNAIQIDEVFEEIMRRMLQSDHVLRILASGKPLPDESQAPPPPTSSAFQNS